MLFRLKQEYKFADNLLLIYLCEVSYGSKAITGLSSKWLSFSHLGGVFMSCNIAKAESELEAFYMPF